ncbi:YdaS family helix-turn-helix protein [Sutterella wadsworthensis]|uniref:YdaS family helix-turn-helix protein n=1 Tax=Sutterella wadsworthensis TaxID=40545 RepID=UPI0013F5E83D|nr:YdaS family helix-turn-helix protein [Sutterella wadsworthensis]DAF78227.1 MAG TPA: Putative antitoxin of bacterial toxin-antitoxin system, YdaS/YdaT [Caudoviricetes sp.]
MQFKDYWDQMPSAKKAEFAKACRCSKGHLRNVAKGYRKASAALSYLIEKASMGLVPKETLRPDFVW